MLTLLAALALAAAPRSAQKPPPVVCPAVLTPPVAVTLKNERGLVLADASAPLFAPQREAEIRVRREGQGRYTVSVRRQGYRPVTLRRVRVEGNECGPVEPTPPTIRLTPVPNAPTIRRFVVLGPRDLRVGSLAVLSAVYGLRRRPRRAARGGLVVEQPGRGDRGPDRDAALGVQQGRRLDPVRAAAGWCARTAR